MSETIAVTSVPANTRQLSLALHVGFVLIGVVNTMLGPILPLLSKRWHLNDAQAGGLFIAQFTGGLIGAILSSILIVRIGFLQLLMTGFGVMAASLIFLSIDSWIVGWLAIGLSGVTLGLTTPATNLLVSILNPLRRASALNVLNLTWGIGAMCSPLLPLMARSESIAVPILVLAALLAVLPMMIWVGARHSLRDLHPANAVTVETDVETSVLRSWLKRSALLAALWFFVYAGTEAAVGGWIASFAQRIGSQGQTMWALMPSFFYGGLLAGRGLAPIILRHVNERRLVIVALITAMAGLALILMSGNLNSVSIGALLAGLGMAPVFPTVFALFTQHFAAQAAKMAGGVFVMTYLGSSFIPWSVGWVSAMSGELRWGLSIVLIAVVIQLVLQFIVLNIFIGSDKFKIDRMEKR
ncbi:MAG TPA: MFS transporter [Blastocatellia bacterium]|nr:MFS transporter [Blastocatellia bacterium]